MRMIRPWSLTIAISLGQWNESQCFQAWAMDISSMPRQRVLWEWWQTWTERTSNYCSKQERRDTSYSSILCLVLMSSKTRPLLISHAPLWPILAKSQDFMLSTTSFLKVRKSAVFKQLIFNRGRKGYHWRSWWEGLDQASQSKSAALRLRVRLWSQQRRQD